MSARIHFSEDDFARPADPNVVAHDQFGNELSVSQDEALWRVRIESKGAAAFALGPSITQAEQLAEDLLDHADQAEGHDVAQPHGGRAFWHSYSLRLRRGRWWRRHRLIVSHDLVWGVVLECRGADGFRITLPPAWARSLALEILQAAKSAGEKTVDSGPGHPGKDLAPRPHAGRLVERIFLGHNSVHRKVVIGMRSGGADYTAVVSPEARLIGMDLIFQADKAEGKKPN
jgi:hypothetical protein